MPFEGLLFSIFFLGGLVWSLQRLIRSKDREFSYLSIFFILLFLVILPINIVRGVLFQSKLTLNAFSTRQDILGLWSYNGSTLLFQKDGSVIIKLTPPHKLHYNLENKLGYWFKNSDFNLYIFNEKKDMENYLVSHDAPRLPPLYHPPKHNGSVFRVIKYDGKYRIVKEYANPDNWDENLEFKKLVLPKPKNDHSGQPWPSIPRCNSPINKPPSPGDEGG